LLLEPLPSVLLTLGSLVLFAAGTVKLLRPLPAVRALQAIGLPATPTLVRAGAAMEVVLAMLSAGSTSPVGPAGVTLAYLGFTVFVVVARRRGTAVRSCGCFGKADTPPSMIHIALDMLFATGAALVAVSAGRTPPWKLIVGPVQGTVFVALAAVATYLAIEAFATLPATLAQARATAAGLGTAAPDADR
jgi:hypothetical protein